MDGVETTYVRTYVLSQTSKQPLHVQANVNNKANTVYTDMCLVAQCYHLVTCVFSFTYACTYAYGPTCATNCERAINGTSYSPTNEKMNGMYIRTIH